MLISSLNLRYAQTEEETHRHRVSVGISGDAAESVRVFTILKGMVGQYGGTVFLSSDNSVEGVGTFLIQAGFPIDEHQLFYYAAARDFLKDRTYEDDITAKILMWRYNGMLPPVNLAQWTDDPEKWNMSELFGYYPEVDIDAIEP